MTRRRAPGAFLPRSPGVDGAGRSNGRRHARRRSTASWSLSLEASESVTRSRRAAPTHTTCITTFHTQTAAIKAWQTSSSVPCLSRSPACPAPRAAALGTPLCSASRSACRSAARRTGSTCCQHCVRVSAPLLPLTRIHNKAKQRTWRRTRRGRTGCSSRPLPAGGGASQTGRYASTRPRSTPAAARGRRVAGREART